MGITPTGLDLTLCANCQHSKHIGQGCQDPNCSCDDVQARKNSKGKVGCFYLLPWESIMELAAVYEYGAKKYAANSWREVPKDPVTGAEPHERYFDAMMRHIVAIQRGQELDPESGLRHIAHVMWGACALAELTRNKK